MEKTRVEKSIRNSTVGLIGFAVTTFVQFITRTVFIKLLGDEYNGVNGLFTNVLSVLNLAELGFAYSVAYALYAPLRNGDEQKISGILNFLRRVYYIVAISVALVGGLCTPFLGYLIKDVSSLPFSLGKIRIYFLIYLGNTVCSYLFSYKRTLVTADEKSYIVSLVDNVGSCILYGAQIVLLLLTRNYYAYLFLMLVKTVLGNLIVTEIANKKYPYLRENKSLRIDEKEREKILKNVGALFFHKVGGVAIYSSATIIISTLVGVVEAGFYSNYLLIVSAVSSLVTLIFNAVTASIGSLCVTAEIAYQKKTFTRIRYLSNLFSVVAFTCYVSLFNSFIRLWVGKDKTFDFIVVLLVSLSATLNILRTAPIAFKTAKGIFYEDRFKPLIEAGVAIVLGTTLGLFWGVSGVVLGGILGSAVAVPIEYYALYKHGFQASAKESLFQLFNVMKTLLFAGGVSSLSYWICAFLPQGIFGFTIKAVLSVSLAVGAYLGFSVKSDAFAYYKNVCKRILKNVRRKNVQGG